MTIIFVMASKRVAFAAVTGIEKARFENSEGTAVSSYARTGCG